jgi:hypothetical protein
LIKLHKDTLNLEVSNPNIVEEIDERTPSEIISEIEKLDKESNKIINKIKECSDVKHSKAQRCL